MAPSNFSGVVFLELPFPTVNQGTNAKQLPLSSCSPAPVHMERGWGMGMAEGQRCQ